MPVNGVLEYLWFRDNDPWWATILRAVTLIALVVLFVIKGMHKVPSGSKALRTRFNKVVLYRRDTYDGPNRLHRRGEAKVVGPGLVIGIPFVHNVMIELVTEQFEPLPPLIRLQPLREFASQINFQVVDLEKALVGVANYKGSLVNSCAAAVRTLVTTQTTLSDDDISDRLLEDESLQQRARELGVRLLKLNVSTSNLTEPAQLAHAFRQEGIVLNASQAAVLSPTFNGASSPALTAVDGSAPAA
jgi:regulator of protease activity HflC (stomatin/prohibitin superfamily)